MARYRRRNHPAHTDKARWAKVRAEVFDRDGWRCQSCGKAGRLECDHKIPIFKGGDPWALWNLQSQCVGCHAVKSRSERPIGPKRRAWRALIDSRMAES